MSWDPIENRSPYPRIDLNPMRAPYPADCKYPTCNCDPRCFMSQPVGKEESDRIWRAVVASAESSNVEAGQ